MNKEKLLELSDTLRGIAEGKEWEYCCFSGPKEEWFRSMIGTDPLSMIARGQGIRLKPQPRKVPLRPEDVNVGDQLRFSDTKDIIADGEHEGSIILSVTKFGVLVASCKMREPIGFVEMFTWGELMDHRIKRATDIEFLPCHKLIEE